MSMTARFTCRSREAGPGHSSSYATTDRDAVIYLATLNRRRPERDHDHTSQDAAVVPETLLNNRVRLLWREDHLMMAEAA